MEYQDELADLLRERFGPKKDRGQPVRYTAAVSLTNAMASLLAEDDFTAFLQAALRAERASRRRELPWPSSPRSFVDHFGRELHNELEAVDGRQEACHIMFALHGLLELDLFSPYIRCACDAWESTVEVVQRVPASAVSGNVRPVDHFA